MSGGDNSLTASPFVTNQEFQSGCNSQDPKKRHLNVLFFGHVDAGKSTIGNHILSNKNEDDENDEDDESVEGITNGFERVNFGRRKIGFKYLDAPGCRTCEVRRAYFETPTTRFTFLDAPGHISYVANMISGASQADVGVLVISAREGEFEEGYEKGGQIPEHVQLAKAMGITKLIVAVNKMDASTVNWSIKRFEEIEVKVTLLLKSAGYTVKQDVQFLPTSGVQGSNLLRRVSTNVCSWWSGVCLLEALDSVDFPPRDPEAPFRLPLIDKFIDMGTVVMGKIESGSVTVGDTLMIMPNKVVVNVLGIYCDEDKVEHAGPGENLRVRLSGIREEFISPGFVLCSVARPVPVVTSFVAQVQFLEIPNDVICTAGYKAILHVYSVVEDCEIVELMKQIDLKTKKPLKKKVMYAKNGYLVLCRIEVRSLICIEKFTDFPQLGRFVLRSEGKTVAIGEVTEIPSRSISS
ncbi:Eukaryotic peptide chain release factor GTP-binding subunit [Heracleum sosnowskyi]|uniref:Eukaryotic peptide chain release factor GTP-binding subunit n=1 Tax=Heracleum sosnowskyi TaxID=360622 RepID=A0AAD8MH04_9APIA|nr:Eukaryotic peptide chain release factor GTP-binding subunit [Heracleum sosnowskyi]